MPKKKTTTIPGVRARITQDELAAWIKTRDKQSSLLTERLLTREDIVKLAVISLSKLVFIAINEDYHFPKPVGSLNKSYTYTMDSIVSFLDSHDLTTMLARKQASGKKTCKAYNKQELPPLDNNLTRQFLTPKDRHKFSGGGRTKTVHVIERNI